MKIIRLMKKYVLKHKAELVAYMLLCLVLWAISMFSPYTVGSFIDSLVEDASENIIWRAVVTLSVIWTAQLVFTYIRNIIHVKLNTQVSFDVNFDLLEHIKRLPMEYFSNKDSAYINRRISSDSSNITGFVLGNVTGLVTTVLTFAVALVILFFINPIITIILCLLIPVYILIYFRFKKPLYDLNLKYTEEQNQFYSKINKQLSNIKVIKLNAWNNTLSRELKKDFSSLFQIAMKNAKVSYIFNNADTLVRYFANITIFIFSGYEI